MRRIFWLLLSVFCLVIVGCQRHTDNNNLQATSHYLESIKHDPNQLQLFLAQMPKGGDIHNHLSGAVYAENAIKFARQAHFCVNPKTLAVTKQKHCPRALQLKNIAANYDLYSGLINDWSMRNYGRTDKAERLEFFDAFLRMVQLVNPNRGKILATVLQRNADQHVDYVELFILPKTESLLRLAAKVPVHDNFQQAQSYLLKHGIKTIAKQMQQQVDGWVVEKNKILHCGTDHAKPGCHVQYRFQDIAIRAVPPQYVFTQLLAGFMLADKDTDVVGVNLVAPEDAPIALRDYHLHMQMFAYLEHQYPNIKTDLHAGELVPGLVPPAELRWHIRDALLTAHADRIGHGVDIAYEHHALNTLQYMAQHHIAVEECLTSNAKLLHLTGRAHPITLYLQHHVPVTLNTDDEGVLRTDITQEYKRAELSYGFSYQTLKNFARNALTYAFIQGKSLWANPDKFIPVSACAKNKIGIVKPIQSCAKFLQNNPKAQLQWHLEQQFKQFEAKIAARNNG